MLQLEKFYEQCYLDFQQSNKELLNSPIDLDQLNLMTKKLFSEINHKRYLKSKKNPLYFLDHKIWTQKQEHLDDPGFDVELKKAIVQGLHLKNKICGTYTTAIEILRPFIEEINQTENRPARILELGSGAGKLTMAIYKQFQESSLKVELTGSDIVPEYADAANAEARKKNYDIRFKVIDAYHLDRLEPNSYDIVFTLHSMHHFLPEELITIMTGAHSIASRAFIGIDAYRGISNLFFIALTAGIKSLISFNSVFLHDAFISGRRMYSAKQLEIMAKIGCPRASIVAKNLRPGLTVIKVKKVPLDFV